MNGKISLIDLQSAIAAQKIFTSEIEKLLGCKVTVNMSIYDHIEPVKSKEIFNLAVDAFQPTVYKSDTSNHEWVYITPEFVVFSQGEEEDVSTDGDQNITG